MGLNVHLGFEAWKYAPDKVDLVFELNQYTYKIRPIQNNAY